MGDLEWKTVYNVQWYLYKAFTAHNTDLHIYGTLPLVKGPYSYKFVIRIDLAMIHYPLFILLQQKLCQYSVYLLYT